MSGHSHWAGIKRKKEVIDQKKGKVFSKLLNAISIAARLDPNPQFNPRLRTTIDKAKGNKVPQDNIENAIKRASEDKNLEEVLAEAYGPEGVAILIEAITDNKNRTISEVKNILNECGAKWAEPGSVRWSFEQTEGEWKSKFNQQISESAKIKIKNVIEKLEGHDDVQKIYANCEI